MTNHILAPIALFIYNRPEHTKKVLRSLSLNPEFKKSRLFIYCDGPKNEDDIKNIKYARELVKNLNHPKKTIIEKKKNFGLAKSIITGVSELVKNFGHVIVVEDDLIVNARFLEYLNHALHKYAEFPQIMQISAHMFAIPEFYKKKKTLFFPNITSWGWATWSRAWRYFDINAKDWELLLENKDLRKSFNLNGAYDYSDLLFRQMSAQIDSWAILWNWSVFRRSGLVVYPPVSFVRNIGFDGSGSHGRINKLIDIFPKKKFIPKFTFEKCFQISNNELFFFRRYLLAINGSFFFRTLKTILNFLRRTQLKYFKFIISIKS